MHFSEYPTIDWRKRVKNGLIKPMFWKKKAKKNTPEKKAKTPEKTAKPSREALIAEATANANAARAAIGEENLEKIRQALEERKNSPRARALELLETMDKSKAADYVRLLSKDDNKSIH